VPVLTLKARVYFFACSLLWDVLSLFHYLDEKVASQGTSLRRSVKWTKPFADLANWALEELWLPVDRENVPASERDLLFSTADAVGDLLISRWGDELGACASKAHEEHPDVSQSRWLSYYYRRFLWRVLAVLDRVLQEPDVPIEYYQHYRESAELFENLALALENEWLCSDTEANVSPASAETVREKLDACALRLSAEWRQAVCSAARELKLPDFGGGPTG
jgi:hypothetical protein